MPASATSDASSTTVSLCTSIARRCRASARLATMWSSISRRSRCRTDQRRSTGMARSSTRRRPWAELGIAGLLGRGRNEAQRRLVVLGVEVAGDGDQPLRLLVEQLVDEEAQLQRLRRPLEGGEEIAFRPAAGAAPLLARELLPGNGARARCAQMQVDDIEPPAAGQLQGADEQRAVERDFLRSCAFGRARQIRVPQRLDEPMAHLALRTDRKARQGHEVVHARHPVPGGTRGRRPLEARVARAVDQSLERHEAPLRRARHVLSVDLLQAQDVGRDPLQDRPQHGDARLQGNAGARLQVEVFDVEGGQAHCQVPGFRFQVPGFKCSLCSTLSETWSLKPGLTSINAVRAQRRQTCWSASNYQLRTQLRGRFDTRQSTRAINASKECQPLN